MESLVRDRPEALMSEGRPPWAVPLSQGRASVNNPEVAMGRFAAPTKSAAVANTIRTGLEDTTDDKTFAGKAARLVAKLLWGSPREETTKLGDNPQAVIEQGLNVWNPASGMIGMLAGKGAKGAPLDKLAKAMEAEKKGLPSQEIWRKFGWERGKDGLWRWEISDDLARLSPAAQEVLAGGKSIERQPLGSVYEHPELYRAYPTLADLPTNVGKGERGGSFMPTVAEGGGEINAIARDPEMMLRVLTHESQHGVQELEKFAVGGSPSTVSQGEVALARSRPLSAKDSMNPVNAAYMRRAGEVEARNAEARLADSDLRKFAPGVTEDVPRMLQTVRFLQETSPQLAVKEKGGMWHPEAVERLSGPLAERLGGGRERLEALHRLPRDVGLGNMERLQQEAADMAPTTEWSKRAIRNYLNKHAGTPTDPLKDVEIPFGEGVKRWEELTDAAIKGHTKTELQGPLGPDPYGARQYLENVKEGEKVWRIDERGGLDISGEGLGYGADVVTRSSTTALQSYLSHVGDYLREHVPPDKLQQYDLVRAVKETAALDARMARDMEKSAASTTKSLPVYKEYPGGFKWVELKAPERLTPEQMKQVKQVTLPKDAEFQGADPFDMPAVLPQGSKGYQALDAHGKPIKSNYTGEEVYGPTPEVAWLAGRLAEEGNQMGHCVGGYCHEVASGESKIYSLRDAKGKSHVTVEVAPGADPKPSFEDGAWVPGERSENILQIKGKQNRAPVAEYLPYVQDFVKGGKWGEVGDLQNAGLMKHPQTGEYISTPHPDSDVMRRMQEHAFRQRMNDGN